MQTDVSSLMSKNGTDFNINVIFAKQAPMLDFFHAQPNLA